jgi:aldose 1-epimerase
MQQAAKVESAAWGRTGSGDQVDVFTLSNAEITVKIATYGARLTSIRTANHDGVLDDVILGSDALDPYLTGKGYLGAIVGRYGNRIANGQFAIDGESFQVPLNDGPNCLHGGPVGFDQKVWQAKPVPNGVSMTCVSAAAEMGFPGTLHSTVTYKLEGSDLRLEYEAVTDAPTVVNLTNHVYFNLAGEGGDLMAHTVRLHAEHFTPVNDTLIPPSGEADRQGHRRR